MRLFKTSDVRESVSLDGLWDFITVTEPGKDTAEAVLGAKDWDCMCVPFCWNCVPKYFKYEGVAWYKTEFVSKSEFYEIVFENIQIYAEIFIDGQKVKQHYGGFLPISVYGTGKGKHSLMVRVDNTHNDVNTIPLSRVDWFHYGGISGSVVLTYFDSAFIKKHRISYELKNNTASCVAEFMIEGTYNGNCEIFADNILVHKMQVQTGKNVAKFQLDEVERWDVDNPRLYYIQIKIECDDIIERIGFRTIEVKDNEILLNESPVTIKGVNRHNEHPDFGFSMPFSFIKKDVDIIKNMGCNFIRGSHYPNPRELLDYLDQIGILFWEEIPMWGYGEAALSDALTKERGLLMHQEMIERDFHHPSIVFWGLHNEIATDTKPGYDITKCFYDHIKKLDDSRPITFATCRIDTDTALEFADVIAMNIYPGWYGGHNPADECEDVARRIINHVKETGNENKPILISEFGAGGIYGENSFYNAKWTEEYQSEVLENTIAGFMKHKEINGVIIWQYCDMRSSFELELTRPRSFNNKGMVDEYRRPKSVYFTVKKLFDNIKTK